MAKIKILDLPKDKKISEEEMKKILGGGIIVTPDTSKQSRYLVKK